MRLQVSLSSLTPHARSSRRVVSSAVFWDGVWVGCLRGPSHLAFPCGGSLAHSSHLTFCLKVRFRVLSLPQTTVLFFRDVVGFYFYFFTIKRM